MKIVQLSEKEFEFLQSLIVGEVETVKEMEERFDVAKIMHDITMSVMPKEKHKERADLEKSMNDALKEIQTYRSIVVGLVKQFFPEEEKQMRSSNNKRKRNKTRNRMR